MSKDRVSNKHKGLRINCKAKPVKFHPIGRNFTGFSNSHRYLFASSSKKPFKNYFLRSKVLRDPPQSPLKRGKNSNSPPFLRGAGQGGFIFGKVSRKGVAKEVREKKSQKEEEQERISKT